MNTIAGTAIFTVIAAVVASQVLSHTNWNEIKPAPPAAAIPNNDRVAAPLPSANHATASLWAGPTGNFMGHATIDGADVAIMIDTGASFVALTHHDAVNMGIAPQPGDYRLALSTANGVAYAAQVHLDSIEIGNVRVDDVPAIIAQPHALGRSLIGMNFLRRLRNFKVQGNQIKLTQ